VAAAALVHLAVSCCRLVRPGDGPVFPVLVGSSVLLVLPAFHLVMSWALFLRFAPRRIPRPLPGLGVDVFVTVLDEPRWLVERTLRAALAIRDPHRTWLLEDGGRSRFEELARVLGAEYLGRRSLADHKAGNLSHALARRRGELVAVLDADHAPEPGFLDRTLGFFADSRVGFVQTMVTFANGTENPFARGAAQSGSEYYNLAAVGKDRGGAAGLRGTNAVIRRRALEEIGGYRSGLAENLATSAAIHAAGWKSAYVREPLAPALAPADFQAFCKQQFKWAPASSRWPSMPFAVRSSVSVPGRRCATWCASPTTSCPSCSSSTCASWVWR
jgi:cellulose synthase (UDP-forming)